MDTIAGYCERCGRRFGLAPPQPGANDLGLETVKSVFRFCVSCSQFVGRSCCWSADAVACTTCVGATSGAGRRIGRKATAHDREELVRLAMSELAAAAGGLADVALAIAPDDARRHPGANSAWDAAWWATAWLVIRAESSRDAASKQLWRRSANDPHPELTVWFKRELAAYEAEFHTVSTGLTVSGRRIAATEDGRDPRSTAASGWRRAMLPIVTAAALVLVAVGIGSGAIDQLVPGFGGAGSGTGGAGPTASERGAVLGGDPAGSTAPTAGPVAPGPTVATGDAHGQTGEQGPSSLPGGTAEPGETPEPPAPEATPDAVLASIEFDTMRMGPLEEGSGITDLSGQPEVVSFPSPFDRSVRVASDEPSGFCLATQLDPGAPFALTLDLYPEVTPAGSLQVMLPANDGQAAVSVPLELLATEPIERWYRASVSWTGAGQAEIELSDVAERRTVLSEQLEPRTAPASSAGSVCVSVSVTTPEGGEGGILLDNLTIEG